MADPVETPEGEQASNEVQARHVDGDAQPAGDIRDAQKPSPVGAYAEDDDADAGLLEEFWLFMKEEKKWWLAPIAVVTLLLFALFVFADSPAAPFIYTLF